MSSVSGIRLPGLATGMDTDTMIKEMLTAEQNKVDKAKQKEQTIKWKQEIYREVMKDIKGFNDKYFSMSSSDSIISSSAWNTLTVSSSNPGVMTSSGGAGASKVDYKFEVTKLAESAKVTSSKEGIKLDSKLVDELNATSGVEFKINLGNDKDGKIIESEPIIIEKNDTIGSLINKINNSTDGKVKASYSEMTGSFSIETKEIGSGSVLNIVSESGGTSKALDFLGLKVKTDKTDADGKIILEEFKGTTTGSQSKISVSTKDGSFIKTLNEDSNSFIIDGVKYDIHTTGSSEITSKQDVQPVVDNMKKFVEDYNKIMDKIYDLVTEKMDRDYPPLTETQKEDMSEEEIEKWEKNAKQGLLRNDSDMRKFMDDMQKSIFGDRMEDLNAMGLTSHEDYNKRGQIALDEKKLIKALENDGEKVYTLFAKDGSSVMESMRKTVNNYVGGSSSIFAKKAGLEKTASAVMNFYSDQLKNQADTIKNLMRKMSDKEEQLYKKFGTLEASMNKFNSQMNYFTQA